MHCVHYILKYTGFYLLVKRVIILKLQILNDLCECKALYTVYLSNSVFPPSTVFSWAAQQQKQWCHKNNLTFCIYMGKNMSGSAICFFCIIVGAQHPSPLRDRPQLTLIAGISTCLSTVPFGFSFDKYTQLCKLRVLLDLMIQFGKNFYYTSLKAIHKIRPDALDHLHSWRAETSVNMISTSQCAGVQSHENTALRKFSKGFC